MTKYYRVKQDTFLWKKGAIIRKENDENGYDAIEDIWDITPVNKSEYISEAIIEHEKNRDFFERIYPDTITGKLYKTKDQLVAQYAKSFKGKEND